MKHSTKRGLAIAGLIAAIIIVWFMLKRNPQLVNQITNDIIPAVAGTFNVSSDGPYTSHDYPLPPVDNGFYLNSGCNFCSKTAVNVAVPASPPITRPANVAQFVYNPPAFGGSGAPSPTVWG